MAEQFYRQKDWSGGMADSEYSGGSGTFFMGYGVDIHSVPGVIKSSQALKKESGSVVASFCNFVVYNNPNTFWFSNTGIVYKRTSGGTWTKVHDAATPILGAYVFNGYVYYATATALGRIAVANANSEATWSSQVSNFAVLDSAAYHPMVVSGLYLLIGNDTKIATVDDTSTFTASGTPDVTLEPVPLGHSINTMVNFGADILVGTKAIFPGASCYLLRWDLVSAAWVSADAVEGEVLVNCFLPVDNYVFVQAGYHGRIYYYNGEILERFKTIPGEYSTYTSKAMISYPQSTCNFLGRALLGVSNYSGNPITAEGVYSLAQYDKGYPMALVCEYVISTYHNNAIKIGALFADNTTSTLLVAWEDDTIALSPVFGVDVIDWTSKIISSYFKTRFIGGNRECKKTFEEYSVSYRSLPALTSLNVEVIPNYSGSQIPITLTDESAYAKYFSKQHIEAGEIQIRVDFNCDGDYSPEVTEVYTKWNNQDNL